MDFFVPEARFRCASSFLAFVYVVVVLIVRSFHEPS